MSKFRSFSTSMEERLVNGVIYLTGNIINSVASNLLLGNSKSSEWYVAMWQFR